MYVNLLIAILLFATTNAQAQGTYNQDWKPAELIDSSQLVALVERMGPTHESPVSSEPGRPIGTALELRVLRVLDGDVRGKETILVFQPAGGIHGCEFLIASKFVIFLRPLTPEQYANISRASKSARAGVLKKFDLNDGDVVWTLAASKEQWMGYYPVEEKPGKQLRSRLKSVLERIGVGTDQDPTEYLTKLVKLRRDSQAASSDLVQSNDLYVKKVMSELRRDSTDRERGIGR